MKKRIKAILGTSILSLSLFTVAIPGFASQTESNPSGGWSESKGYYTNSEGSMSTFSTSSPDSHVGERLTKIESAGGVVFYAAYGATVWKNTYHYTTAQMELSNGTVKTTSGRQWGTGGTTAQSPWYLPGSFENTEARTYWGR